MKTIRVVCAVIIKNGKILISKRPPNVHLANFWEFPGGKMHDGETPEQALAREIEEELGVNLSIMKPFETIWFQYPDQNAAHLELIFFLCRIHQGSPRARAATEIRWVDAQELDHYNFPEADTELLKKLPGAIGQWQD